MKSHSGKRRTQGTTLHPSRSRVAELYAFDEQIHSSFYERCTPVCLVEATGRQGATLHPPVTSGFMPDVKEKASSTSCDATGLTIAGFDEAGRGALAGPVVVACVHFDLGSLLPVASDFMSDVEGLVPDGENCSVGPCLPVPMRQTGARRETSQTSCDATTIHPSSILHTLAGLDDSKRLTPRKREALYERICALSKWGVGWASHSVIDRRGIVPALTLAARRAYRAMGHPVDLLLLDRGLSLHERHTRGATLRNSAASGLVPDGGNCSVGACPRRSQTPQTGCDATAELAFTKGDGRSLHIAAASILAKVSRDRAMTRVHARFPDYGFDRNKGYGTASHFATLHRLGPSSIHRRSFRLA